MVDKKKELGKIYTPSNIVNMMLDYGGYVISSYIINKHVIDNSCGDGRFLIEIVRRYIESHKLVNGSIDVNEVRNGLETYIHGIDVDAEECIKCKNNLSVAASGYGIYGVDWDIRHANSLKVRDFDGKMDFIFGNPPYVRIHNLKQGERNPEYELFRSFKFTRKGMSDLYLAFFEIGLRMRNETGILCYITPSGWLTNASGKNFRRYVMETKELIRVVDFDGKRVFDNVSTYVMISLFGKKPNSYICYDKFVDGSPRFQPETVVYYDDAFIDGKLYFGNKDELKLIKNVTNDDGKCVVVKNGYATLADNVFIKNLPELSKYTIDVIKSSTGEWKKCLFPYDNEMKPISLEVIYETAEDVYDYIMNNEEVLKKRSYDGESWYLFGRSQGLNDTHKNKISINSLIRDKNDLNLNKVDGGCGVYGGMYILTDIDFSIIENELKSDRFISYVKSLRKYKSGGYYTFSTKDLEKYLNYALCGS